MTEPIPFCQRTTTARYRLDLAELSIGELQKVVSRSKPGVPSPVSRAAALMINSLNMGGVIYWCGNGGSASQSDHFAAELLGRYSRERPPLASMSLTNSAVVLCIENDFGHEHVFSRQIVGLGRPGDVLVGLTTSGRSVNVLEALRVAAEGQLSTVAMVGDDDAVKRVVAYVGGCSVVLHTPGVSATGQVQQLHLGFGHMICDAVETVLFGGQM